MAAGPAQLPQGTARFAQQQQQAQQQASNAPGWQQAGVAGGAQSPPAQQSQQVPRQLLQNLPLQMDPAIAAAATTLQLAKRQLGENFDQRLNFTHNHFVSTADNKNVLACGFWDNSFRAFSTDSGTIYWNDWIKLDQPSLLALIFHSVIKITSTLKTNQLQYVAYGVRSMCVYRTMHN